MIVKWKNQVNKFFWTTFEGDENILWAGQSFIFEFELIISLVPLISFTNNKVVKQALE